MAGFPVFWSLRSLMRAMGLDKNKKDLQPFRKLESTRISLRQQVLVLG